jgi:hypothetical protein
MAGGGWGTQKERPYGMEGDAQDQKNKSQMPGAIK